MGNFITEKCRFKTVKLTEDLFQFALRNFVFDRLIVTEQQDIGTVFFAIRTEFVFFGKKEREYLKFTAFIAAFNFKERHQTGVVNTVIFKAHSFDFLTENDTLSRSFKFGEFNSELIGNKIYQRTFPDRNLPHASALATVTGFSVLFPLACVAWWLKRQDDREAKRLAEATARKLSGGAA